MARAEEKIATTLEPIVSARVSNAVSIRARAYYELMKPNLSGLVVVTGVLGFYLASSSIRTIDWVALVHLVVGLGLTSGGACALNMVLERDLDARMRRTQARPIPSGRVGAVEALVFSLVVFTAGFTDLALFVGAYPALLSLFTMLVYGFIYTPMKRKGPIAIAIGAIPGAIPPVMGWAAVRSNIGAGGIALFAILFLWQFPHFLALARLYQDDYARGGFRFLPVGEGADRKTGLGIAIGCACLIVATIVPVALGLVGFVYGAGALLVGIAFFIPCLAATRDLSPQRARSVFIASVCYLPALLGLMVLDRVL